MQCACVHVRVCKYINTLSKAFIAYAKGKNIVVRVFAGRRSHLVLFLLRDDTTQHLHCASPAERRAPSHTTSEVSAPRTRLPSAAFVRSSCALSRPRNQRPPCTHRFLCARERRFLWTSLEVGTFGRKNPCTCLLGAFFCVCSLERLARIDFVSVCVLLRLCALRWSIHRFAHTPPQIPVLVYVYTSRVCILT